MFEAFCVSGGIWDGFDILAVLGVGTNEGRSAACTVLVC